MVYEINNYKSGKHVDMIKKQRIMIKKELPKINIEIVRISYTFRTLLR